ncbi:kinase-like domain-containing protein [Collybia nuda]|uniref:Kinase-like domain-containing protein n=1 Tax=Collybia nuda TaxID=64659 RepID=A0A9P6CG01_9AGAR|nr:kinase-like domain-containing protein [Collybia nuda]
MATWLSWDTLTSLRSHQTVIDCLRAFPDWQETPQLRKAVALDVDALCARLFNIIHTPSQYRALSNLKDHNAQAMLNLLQNLLDSPLLDSRFRNPFVGALLRLSGKSGLVPEALVQDQVMLDVGDAFAAGAFGELYTGSFRGQAVAVKVFKFYQNTDIARYLKTVSRETLIWRQLFHPHVLPFICVYYYPTDNHPKIGLVSPWMKHGNVQQFLRQVPDTDRTSLVVDIAEGLSYLHSMKPKIIHGDLKAVNVLITDAGTACIADFGLARALDSEIVNFSSWSNGHGSGGSLRWMAPELFDQEEDAEVCSDTMTDIYAFGSVCYEIFSGCVPFHTITNDYQIMSRIVAGRRPLRPIVSEPSLQSCSCLGLNDDMWLLIEDCWKKDPTGRPTATEIVSRLPKRPNKVDTAVGPHPSRILANSSENIIAWAISHPHRDIEPDAIDGVILEKGKGLVKVNENLDY